MKRHRTSTRVDLLKRLQMNTVRYTIHREIRVRLTVWDRLFNTKCTGTRIELAKSSALEAIMVWQSFTSAFPFSYMMTQVLGFGGFTRIRVARAASSNSSSTPSQVRAEHSWNECAPILYAAAWPSMSHIRPTGVIIKDNRIEKSGKCMVSLIATPEAQGWAMTYLFRWHDCLTTTLKHIDSPGVITEILLAPYQYDRQPRTKVFHFRSPLGR